MKSRIIIVIALLFAFFLMIGCSSLNPASQAASNDATQFTNGTQGSASSPESPDNGGESPLYPSLSERSAASSEKAGNASEIIEIKDKMFIAQVNDIYLNAADYLGKKIKYEGVFDIDFWEGENLTYYYVIRYGPGCCGDDGNVGFEIVWDGDLPDKNDWVEVIGILEEYKENGWLYLRLRVSSLTVLETRGEEYVTQ